MANVFEIIFKATGLEGITGAIKHKLATLVTLAGAWRAASAAFSNYLEKQDALADLDSGLQQAGQLTDEYRNKLVGLADEMERTAGIADEKMLSAMGRLAREGMDPAQSDQMVGAMKNLAALMGGDVNQAAIMLGKAMHGNFDTFGRMGIKVKDMDELFSELAVRGGGLLEARMKTIKGAMENVRNAADDFGVSVTAAMAKIVSAGGDPVDYWNRFAMGVRQAGENIEANLGGTVDVIKNLLAGRHWAAGELNAKSTGAALKDFSKRQAEVAAASEEMAKGFDQAFYALRRLHDEQNEKADADLQLAQEQINRDEQSGKIGATEADLARSRLTNKAERDKLDREMQNAHDEIKQADEVIEAGRNNPDLADKVQSAQRTRDSAMGKLKTAGTRSEATTIRDQIAEGRFKEQKAKDAKEASEKAASEKKRLEEENDPLNQLSKFEAAGAASDKLMKRAQRMADEIPDTVTEADAIAAIEAALGRRLRGEETRYKRMNGELKKMAERLANARN